MARKMFEKAGLIPGLQAGPKPAGPIGDSATAAEPPKAKTAPGTMMGFLTAQSGAVQEAEVLKARLKLLEEDSPLRKLDPAIIRPSKWANRHEASFLTAEFHDLKAEIAAAGGNVQPIKVRPVSVLNGSTPLQNGLASRSRPRSIPPADATQIAPRFRCSSPSGRRHPWLA